MANGYKPAQDGPNGQSVDKPEGWRGAYSQMLELQGLMMNDARNPKTTVSCRTQIARSYAVLEEEKRKLKMRPLPKPIDTEKLKKPKQITINPTLASEE
jgi:hypothetical protein